MPRRKPKSKMKKKNAVPLSPEESKDIEVDDLAYADTDSDMENLTEPQQQQEESNRSSIPKLFRLSSRVASLKRRGKFQAPRVEEEHFDFYAEDYITVRAPDQQFYLCRVLEDVPAKSDQINIAWYEKINKNRYKVSYDDTIYKSTVLMHVHLKEAQENPNLFYIPIKFIKETQELLKESIEKEGEKYNPPNSDDDDDDDNEIEEASDDAQNEYEPAAKKKKSNRGSARRAKHATPTKGKKTASNKENPQKVLKRKKGLIPNPEIKLLGKDPTFCKDSEVPLISSKQAVRAVLSDDKELLKQLIADVDNVYSVLYQRSYNVKYDPLYYAVLKQDKEFILLLQDAADNRKVGKAITPITNVNRKSTGRYNFHTFGHAVREITVSRKNKEGDNALLYEYQTHALEPCKVALKSNMDFDIYWECFVLEKGNPVNQYEMFTDFHIAVMYGHLELAGKIIEKSVKDDGYGYNFLHKETLINRTEPLSPFKSASVTKKTSCYNVKEVSPIHCACINPNAKYIEELCKIRPEYNFPDWQDSRPIHYAAACSGDGPLKFLLGRGVDPNSQNKLTETPLIIAAKCNRVHNIDALMECTINVEDENGELQKQVNIDAKCQNSKAALHYASKKGHVESVKALLKHGATIDIKTSASKENMTPLGYAAAMGQYDVVKVLIEHGANPVFRMRRRKTPLIYACLNGHSQIVAYLLNIGVDPDAADSSDNTPLHYAAAYGWFYCVKLLLEGGANPRISNNWKTTALSIALLKQHVEIGDLLLSCDVDANIRDDEGRTLLMKIINTDFSTEQLKLVKYLVTKHNADVKFTDVDGWSALHFVASNTVYETQKETRLYKRNYVYSDFANVTKFNKELSEICLEMVSIIVKAGADVNCLDSNGESPMMIALTQRNYPLIEFLMKNGGKVSAGCCKKSNENVFHRAVTNILAPWNRINLEEMFPDESFIAFPAETVESVQYKENEAEIMEKISKTYHEIDEERMHLSKKVNIELLMSIINSGCDVNGLTVTGESALMVAVKNKNVELCDILLTNKGNPEIGESEHGKNVLHFLASQCTDSETIEILKKILDNVPSLSTEIVNKRDNAGFTPILRAADVYYNITANDEEKNRRIKSLFEIFITNFNADITLNVVPKKANDNTEKRYGEDMNILFLLQNHADCWEESESIFHMVVNLLGVNHALFNQRDACGRTVIHYGLRRQIAHNIVNYLVRFGCDVNLRSENVLEDKKAPSLLLASEMNVGEDLLLGISRLTDDVNVGNSNGFNIGHSIASSGRDASQKIRLFEDLLKFGLDINKQDADGRTVLHYAIAKAGGDYEEMTEFEEFLIANAAKVNIECKEGRYPLHCAFTKLGSGLDTRNRDPMSIVKLLCEVETEDLDGMSFTDYINHGDKYKRTALHYGCLNGATISCSKLKKHLADDTKEDVDGNTPFALALKNSHHGCAMMVLQQGASPLCSLNSPITESQFKEYQKELAKNPWVWNHKDQVVQPKGNISASFQIAIKKNWKDLAYLMLEVSGLPLFYAIKAGIIESKMNLVLTLLSQEKDHQKLLTKDENNRNLLHLLARHSTSNDISGNTQDFSKFYNSKKDKLIQPMPYDKYSTSTKELAKTFINAGVRLTEVDSKGKTPLHYAIKHNFALAELFIQLGPNQLKVKDEYGRTPLVVVAHTLSTMCSKPTFDLIRQCIAAGSDLNVCYKGKCKETPTRSLVNTAVLLKNEKYIEDDKSGRECNLLDVLLKEGINVNFGTKEGVTPLMVAIRLNYADIVKQLLQRKPDLKHQDKEGNSYLHACVQTLDYGSHENEEMMLTLLKAGVPTNLKNNNNETALDVARKQKSGVMQKHLMAAKETLMDIDSDACENGFLFEQEHPPSFGNFSHDYKADAAEEIKCRIGDVVKEHDDKVMVDSALEMAKTGEVYYDPVTNKPYDVTLTRIDTRRGAWGLNLFYKLQVIYHKGKNLWILFNRWGRISCEGQHQQTPFDTAEEATVEFKKIFRSKTGNLWCNVDSFEDKPKLYRLVLNEKNPERMKKYQENVLQSFDEKKCAKSCLSEPLKKLMKSICNGDLFSRNLQLDESRMPLGMISMESIDKAKKILNRIEVILEKRSSSASGENTTEEYEQIFALSNEYFMIVPPTDCGFEDIQPFNDIHTLQENKLELSLLSELSVSYKMLLAAQYRSQEMNPYDYCYGAMNVRLEEMSPDLPESKLISKFIYREGSDPDINIENVFRVQRNDEEYRSDMKNKYLLWHGTNTAHMMSILKDGLQITPHNSAVVITGSSLGKGIYFSWDFETAYGFTSSRWSDSVYAYVLLCEVALGEIKYYDDRNDDDDDDEVEFELPKDADSLWCHTSDIPDPDKSISMPYGPVLMVGKEVNNENNNGSRNNSNSKSVYFHHRHEAVIYDEKQVKIRYIVQIKM